MSSVSLPPSQANSAGWLTFTYVSFGVAAGMTALGIWAMPADLWVKGYMMMATVFLCGATFTLAKTVRDEHEAKRFTNRIEDAKTEKLLMEMNRG
ncbi:MAG: YiaA/YiaB family inner membrane protein [Filomicrobium sp.]